MPIEREFKYVLDHRNGLEEQLNALGVLGVTIKQGYLSKGGRIRSKTYPEGHGFHGTSHFVFTYKHKLKSQPGCLEIENTITEHDFQLGWQDADHVINKTRYVIEGHNDPLNGMTPYMWEVDIFRDADGDVFFAMAECEVHEGQDRPREIHEFVKANLVFAVPEEDNRFQNRKISDVRKANKLFKEVARVKA